MLSCEYSHTYWDTKKGFWIGIVIIPEVVLSSQVCKHSIILSFTQSIEFDIKTAITVSATYYTLHKNVF